ncbi:MAG: acyl-CoA-binding protein [Bacteroidota bacterium]
MDITEELLKAFESSLERVRKLPTRPSNDMLLKLYGLNKQATKGDINIEKPDMFDVVKQAKYAAWEELQGLSKGEAMKQYIQLVDQLFSELSES